MKNHWYLGEDGHNRIIPDSDEKKRKRAKYDRAYCRNRKAKTSPKRIKITAFSEEALNALCGGEEIVIKPRKRLTGWTHFTNWLRLLLY